MPYDSFIGNDPTTHTTMKLLSLTAAALLVAAPAQAQEWRFSQQPAERIHGRTCRIKIEISGKPDKELQCNHMVITNNGVNPNFHFDNEDETMGVTFVMDPARPYVDANSKGFSVVGYMYRHAGSSREVFEPSKGGLCISYNNGWGCHVHDSGVKVTAFLMP